MDNAEHRTDVVIVTFNGDEKKFSYHPAEPVSALLAQSKAAFHVEGNNRLALFTEAGVELPDGQSLEQAGVTVGEVLVLRQSSTRGGM